MKKIEVEEKTENVFFHWFQVFPFFPIFFLPLLVFLSL